MFQVSTRICQLTKNRKKYNSFGQLLLVTTQTKDLISFVTKKNLKINIYIVLKRIIKSYLFLLCLNGAQTFSVIASF